MRARRRRLDGHGERLARDPLLVLEQVGVRLRNRQLDPVGQLEARVLAQRVHRVDEVVDAPRAHELVVEVEVERDGDAVGRGHCPPLLAVPLDEHLVARELVAGHADASVRKLLELARLERGSHRAELLAELRPEDRQVRLDAKLARLDLSEGDVTHA